MTIMTRIDNMPATNNVELPAFFQTGNRVVEECLEVDAETDDSSSMSIEEDDDDTIDEPVQRQIVGIHDESENLRQTVEVDDETITFELLDFFDNVAYDDMDEHFRSFEYGDSWVSNPIFTDEFAFTALPIALSNIIYELNSILQIQRVVPSDWNRNDRRYSSLSRPQQIRLRELIHETSARRIQLDDLRNRIRGYRCRTASPQIKFLLNKILDVVEELL
jgi:hypothetical protein